MSIILGIDPGTTDMGYALIRKTPRNYEILDFGVIHTTALLSDGRKLLEITQDLEALLTSYPIQSAGIERLFFAKNAKTVIGVAQSRGVVLMLLEKYGIPVTEYSPPQVKKAICQNGSADKKQVQRVLKQIFGLSELPKPDDAADALAISYIHAMSIRTSRVLPSQS